MASCSLLVSNGSLWIQYREVRLYKYVCANLSSSGGLTVPGEPRRGKSVYLDRMLAIGEDLVVIGPYLRGAERQG